ncbi:unnamed protein product (mitochondrion) [Plasmodiophora brassicae]|uniref:Uncharacterized protein n=1 Tax=Plasmodiophora brassicae TaxID=37360 RepID=A0A3P3YBZ8_PLABS|nr:unnamed protein product [Plasmodiophora brassicae]
MNGRVYCITPATFVVVVCGGDTVGRRWPMGCRERVWEFLLEDGLESRSQLREPPNVVADVASAAALYPGFLMISSRNTSQSSSLAGSARGNIVIDYRHRMLTLMSYVGSRVTEAWEPFPFYRQRPRSEMVSGLIDDL